MDRRPGRVGALAHRPGVSTACACGRSPFCAVACRVGLPGACPSSSTMCWTSPEGGWVRHGHPHRTRGPHRVRASGRGGGIAGCAPGVHRRRAVPPVRVRGVRCRACPATAVESVSNAIVHGGEPSSVEVAANLDLNWFEISELVERGGHLFHGQASSDAGGHGDRVTLARLNPAAAACPRSPPPPSASPRPASRKRAPGACSPCGGSCPGCRRCRGWSCPWPATTAPRSRAA